MSKQNDKAKEAAAKLLTSMTGGRNPEYDDSEGFQTLGPTEEGQRKLNEVRLRRGKKSSDTPAIPEPKKPRPYEDYDPSDAILLISKAYRKVADGKYNKAVKDKDSEIISALIDAFLNMDKDLECFEEVVTGITKLLRVCKSLYEYNANGTQFLDNDTYDRVLTKYRGYGYTEPTGIVSKSAKGKTEITYPTLHNNMDKAYCIRSGDAIPSGVKEDGKIEDFLIGAYKTLGLSSEAEIQLELSPKIDGVSVNGTIDGIQLADPQTRGDESKSLKVIGLDRLEVGDKEAKESFGIQYEVFVTNEDRVAASAYLKLDQPYVSNRHAAAGIVNRLCTCEDDDLLQYLSFYPIEAEGLSSMTYVERMKYLKAFGIVPKDMIDRKIVKGNLKSLLKQIEEFFDKLSDKREDLSYAIDGMVITLVDDAHQTTLGRSGRTNQYQIAMKFNPSMAVAVVEGIHLDTGRKGFRTIQIDLKHPVFLDGVRYDHVPAASADLFEEMKVRKGSQVAIRRVGDVIPSIEVIKTGNGDRIPMPDTCPDCGSPLGYKNKRLYCENLKCPGNIGGRIIGFLDGLGMDGYGETFVESLIDTMGCTNLGDLFDLTEEDMEKEGLKGKLYRNFPEALRKAVSKKADYEIVGIMGIPDLGPNRAKELFRTASKACSLDGGYAYGTIPLMLKDGSRAVNNCWNRTVGLARSREPGYGIRVFTDAIGNKIGERVFNEITKTYADILSHEVSVIEKHISSFTVDIGEPALRMGHTGIEPDDDIRELCRQNGIEIVDGKSFDILLTADRLSNSAKMQTAQSKRLPVFTRDELFMQYGERASNAPKSAMLRAYENYMNTIHEISRPRDERERERAARRERIRGLVRDLDYSRSYDRDR